MPRDGCRTCGSGTPTNTRSQVSGSTSEIYVAPEVAEQRIAAAVAAGGTVVDDSDTPSLTVIADQDGNRGIVYLDASAAKKD